PVRGEGHGSVAGRRHQARRAPQASEQERRDRHLPRCGPRLLRRLPSLVQPDRGRRCLEALHGTLRQVAQGLTGDLAMPFVNIRIYEGWGKERKDEIARRVTEAITDVTRLPKEAVWVVVEEVDPPDWYVAGKPGERMKQ